MEEQTPSYSSRTMANRLDSEPAAVSPLQGAKVLVSNLQESVSQDDIIELFGDIGALKRAKVIEPGTAEIVFVKMSDAAKAVEIYHNRQLDGKAMKCRVTGAAAAESKYGSKY
jgi:RNA recognition motif-containing protein